MTLSTSMPAENNKWISTVIKLVAFQILYVLMHFAYGWFPYNAVKLFSCTIESPFEHMKMAFFAYTIVSIVEIALTWRTVESVPRRIYSRLFATIIIPWLTFSIFYLAPAFYGGPLPTVGIEILYSNVVLFIAALFTTMLEAYFENALPPRSLRAVLIGLFALMLVTNTIFAFRAPWADVFAAPFGEDGHAHGPAVVEDEHDHEEDDHMDDDDHEHADSEHIDEDDHEHADEYHETEDDDS